MKKINILLISFLMFTFAACEKNQDMYKVLPVDEVIPPVFESHADIVIDADNFSSTTTFRWQPADFGTLTATEYYLYAIVGGSEDILVSSSYGDSLVIALSTINTIVLQAGATVGIENYVTFILKASISTAYEKVTSNPIFVKITPFSAAPEAVHIVGDVLGSHAWDNANYEYIMFRDNNLAVNVYTSNFKAGGLKFNKNTNLGSWDYMYGDGGSGILLQNPSAGNINISSAGYYTVTANVNQLTYSIIPYDASSATTYTVVSLIGEFSSWGSDMDLTKTDYDPHIWIVDNVNLPAGELKFRANYDWGINWGAEDQFPYGKGVSGGANIVVPDAGTYFVKFNDLTGHYVFYKK
ncbi:MAG: SusF/SusE family outer membrane protein [Prevotellaceae bacterium]|nr:SusF/SusE family outer membrane protein [Prevotellaceae bacterium]